MTDADRPAAPTVDALLALDADGWARTLAAARRALRGLDDPDATTRRLLAVPTARLVGGRSRTELATVVATDARVWTAVVDDLDADEEGTTVLAALTGAAPAPAPGDGAATAEAGPDPTTLAELDRLRARVDDLRAARRALRADLDRAERRLAGAVTREATTRRALDEEVTAHTTTRDDLARAMRELAGWPARRDRAVERAERRSEAAIARLETELGTRRRDVAAQAEELAAVARREARRAAVRQRTAARRAVTVEKLPRRGGWGTATPGRPSRLPSSVLPDTPAAFRALVRPGTRVLVDGYNVSRTHRDDLDLEGQRRWLEDRLRLLLTRVEVELEVIWDGDGPASRGARVRGLVVRFSGRGITADDDIEFGVAALAEDHPVVVVTDDRELRDRVRVHGADVVATHALLGALP